MNAGDRVGDGRDILDLLKQNVRVDWTRARGRREELHGDFLLDRGEAEHREKRQARSPVGANKRVNLGLRIVVEGRQFLQKRDAQSPPPPGGIDHDFREANLSAGAVAGRSTLQGLSASRLPAPPKIPSCKILRHGDEPIPGGRRNRATPISADIARS